MPKKIKWINSISTGLLKWFLLLSLSPIIAISLISYKSTSSGLYTAVSNDLQNTSIAYVNFIQNWFSYRYRDISSWSDQRSTIDFMKALNSGFKKEHADTAVYIKSIEYNTLTKKHQTDLLKIMQKYDYIYDIFMIDLQGNILYTAAKENDLGTNLQNGPYSGTLLAGTFRQTLADKKIHFSDFEYYPASVREIYGFLSSPILSKNGDILGVFAIQIKPDYVFKQLETGNAEDNGVYYYLIGAKDLTLRSMITDKAETLKRKIETEQTAHYKSEHADDLEPDSMQKETVINYLGPNGKNVIGVHHPINILGVQWVLFSEMDEDKALGASHDLALEMLYIAIFAIVIILSASYLVSRRMTRPIQKLVAATKAISEGKERTSVSIDADNEIGQLADTFNKMIKELDRNDEALKEHSRKAEKALHELQEQKLALDAHAIVAITDVKGTINYVNQKFADISGYSIEELIGQNHRLLNSGLYDESFWKEMYHTISHGKVWHAEIRNKAKDGHFYWVDTTIVPFMDEDGKPASYTAIRADITERKEAEEKLIEAKKHAEIAAQTKAEFLASMSHEIRTPMNGVIGMLGLLQNSKLDDIQRHQAKVAQSSAQSLLTLINDILDFSKVEAGKLELEELEFNLRNELGDFIETMAFKATEKDIELILDLTKVEHEIVIADPSRLRQILTNLVSNAIKFTSDGEVLVTCSLSCEDETHGRLDISVKDSGIGIPHNKLDLLFDPFTQVDASTTRQYGGTGLGLSIVKKLTDLMGGDITVESELAKGSVFSFHIQVGLGKETNIIMPHVSVNGKRVLIVDDNSVNREVLDGQLKHWKMQTFEADSVEKALLICADETKKGFIPPFDVALVDMHMPDRDGSDFGQSVRDIPEYDKMKMVMMTSVGSREDSKAFAKMGFNAFFTKPTTTKDLFNALNVLIEDADALKEAGDMLTKETLNAFSESPHTFRWPENLKILLVDDNLTNQIVANGILETFDLQADVANNGKEALTRLKEAAETQAYTIVLMDCQMPIMDGYSATEAIRRGEAGEENITIPVIAMTANAMKGDKEQCLTAGMDDYLTKPIDPSALKTMLSKWMPKL